METNSELRSEVEVLRRQVDELMTAVVTLRSRLTHEEELSKLRELMDQYSVIVLSATGGAKWTFQGEAARALEAKPLNCIICGATFLSGDYGYRLEVKNMNNPRGPIIPMFLHGRCVDQVMGA
jgi:hypothetical protein